MVAAGVSTKISLLAELLTELLQSKDSHSTGNSEEPPQLLQPFDAPESA